MTFRRSLLFLYFEIVVRPLKLENQFTKMFTRSIVKSCFTLVCIGSLNIWTVCPNSQTGVLAWKNAKRTNVKAIQLLHFARRKYMS